MNWACPLRHAKTWHRGRDANGVISKICDRCQQPIEPLLGGEVITTPLKQVIAGEPRAKATRVRQSNVVPMRESSR